MLKVKFHAINIFIFCLVGSLSTTNLADQNTDGTEKALSAIEVARNADRNNSGFVDYNVNAQMVLYDARGNKSSREMQISVFEVPEDGDKSKIIFQSPKDQKGVALLTHNHRIGSDDQFLYLPSIKRVKRITSQNKSGPFVGSEFAFEDIVAQEIDKYTYELDKTEDCATLTCYVVDRHPVDKYSGYTLLKTWYDSEAFRVKKIEYYDKKNSLLKVLTLDDYKIYDTKWRGHHFVMDNKQTGNKTELVFSEYSFNTGLQETEFDSNALKRLSRSN